MTRVKLSRWLGAVGLTLTMTAGGVGVAGASSRHHPETTVAKKVVHIIASENAAIDRAKAKNEFRAVSHDFSAAARKLGRLHYPKKARADAHTLVSALNKLAYDADQLAAAKGTLTAASALLTTVVSDEGAEVAASDALRSKLGLPPAKL